MEFTKINDVNNDNIHNRTCIMLVNFNKKEESLIKNICGFTGVRDCILLDKRSGNTVIKDILENNISLDCEDGFSNKAIVFNNLPNIKINAFLESLKKMRIKRPLTAIVTDTSLGWTLNELLYNLVEERKALSSGKSFTHK